MRRVIVNSTPIIVLCNIGLLDILKALYAEICIPEAVYREVTEKDDSACQVMNYPAASCGVSKVATSTYNPICYTALFSLRFYRLFYNFFPVPVLSHIYL